jgi:hypothetical protein
MSALQNKTILIVSPQAWGKMFISKHHYAIELAKYGNTVYFLNPPIERKDLDKKIRIEACDTQKGLYLVHHRLSFPYNIKFHFIGLFHTLMRPHVKDIIKAIGRPIDIIWSFDLGNLYPFDLFPANSLKIFHPVDEPLNQTAIDSSKGSQIIFSVTREILDKYCWLDVPSNFINHGLAEPFLLPVDTNKPAGDPVRVGLSGNLLRADLDRDILLKIVNENPEVIFDCWGSYASHQTNIGGGEDAGTIAFVDQLKALPNLVLHGALMMNDLAKAIHQVDAFLICYNIEKDQSSGTNYHKIMEYLSTGKVIISNNVTTYHNRPVLVQMVEERNTNEQLTFLFKKIIKELAYFNSPALQQERISFSRDNTYTKHIGNIEKILDYFLQISRHG